MKRGPRTSPPALIQTFFPVSGPTQFDAHLDGLVEATHETPPKRLCHYTTEEGLRGVLTSRELWAVDFRAQQTDVLEFRHADAQILEAVSDLQGDAAISEVGAFALHVFTTRYEDKKFIAVAAPDIFITCFSERPDNPKLWRDYGSGNAGFAIEFDVLDEKRDIGMGANFWRVEYEVQAVAAHVRRFFCEALLALDLYVAANSHDIAWPLSLGDQHLYNVLEMTVRALFMDAALVASRHKSNTYAEDSEWRICYLLDRSAHVPVYERPKRHVKVPLRRSADILPSIRAIHIGRHVSIDLERSIREMVTTLGYACPVVRTGV